MNGYEVPQIFETIDIVMFHLFNGVGTAFIVKPIKNPRRGVGLFIAALDDRRIIKDVKRGLSVRPGVCKGTKSRSGVHCLEVLHVWCFVSVRL